MPTLKADYHATTWRDQFTVPNMISFPDRNDLMYPDLFVERIGGK
jgi:hypothetical protein